MHISRSRRPGAVLLACGMAALALLAAPAPASAASSTCDASPLRASLLGGPPIEPVTANRGQPTCRTTNAQGEERGALLATGALAARTALTPDGRAEATSEIADLRLVALPELPPGVGVVEIPSPLPLLLPGPIRLDLRRALQDLLLPGGLLSVRAVRATATARCVDGSPQLAGASEIAGISLAGIELPTDRVVERALDLSLLDTGLIDLPLVPPELAGLVRSVLAPVLSTLLPPTLVNVRIAPGEQVREGGRLIQRALHAEVSVLGQPVADIVAGEAAAGVQCGGTRSSAGLTRDAEATSADLAMACTKRDLVLIDVIPGRRVRLLGAADRRFIGRRVRILFTATGRTAATATVGPDRLFRTTAKIPPRALRGTNRARYQAVIDDERSLRLKLMRRMQVRRIASAGGKVTIAGRVVRPLGRPPQEVVVRRRISCRASEVVGRFTPARDGTFEVTVPAPAGVGAAMYRLTTRVRKRPHRPKLFPTFTLPRVVELQPTTAHYTS